VEAAWTAATAAVTSVAACVVLQIWRANPRVPFQYAGDANLNATIIKGIIENGWYQRIPAVGAPGGYDMHDFPLGGDNLQFVLLKVMTFFSRDWALILNAYYLLTFALVAAVAYIVFRRLGLGRGLSLGLATVFSLLPYHFIPGEGHLLLSGYLVVPLAALLVLTVFSGGLAPLTGRGGATPGSRWRSWAPAAALCVLIGCGGGYYAFFAVLLLGVAGGLAFLSAPTRRGTFHAAILMGLILLVGTVNNVPSLLYWHAHGRNPEVAQRSLGESDLYALHIVDLVLPVEHHRVGPLADLKAKRERAAVLPVLAGAPNSPLGLATAAGLALSVLGAAAMVLDNRFGRSLGPARRRFGELGLLNLACMLFATIGGFSLLVAMAGFLQIRVWARMTVFIAFFSVVALGLALTAATDALRARLSRQWGDDVARHRLRRAALIGGPLLLVLAVLDQTTTAMVPPYADNRAAFTSDRGFVREVERRMPRGAAVFQLPIVSYPERPPVVEMADYDLFRGYLHSKDLRWSYGAMRGRPADWTPDLAGRPLEDLLDRVTAAGFEGLYIDRFGFADRATELERQLTASIGPAMVFSRDERLSFFDLRARARQQRDRLGTEATAALGQLVLHPVVATWDDGFFPLAFSPPSSGTADAPYYPKLPGQTSYRHAKSHAVVELANPLPSPRPVRLTFSLASSLGRPGVLEVDAGGSSFTFPVTPTATETGMSLVLPPGPTSVTFRSTVPVPPDEPSFRLDEFRIDDAAPAPTRR
jgi:phosphoglycerol transferase